MWTSDKSLKGLRIDIPACVPVYDRYPSNTAKTAEPLEYRYISLPSTLHKSLAAYVVHAGDFASNLEEGDIVLVDRIQSPQNGDSIAGFVDGFLHIGRLRIMDNELRLENRSGHIYLQKHQLAGVIVTTEKFGNPALPEPNFN